MTYIDQRKEVSVVKVITATSHGMQGQAAPSAISPHLPLLYHLTDSVVPS